MAAPKKNEFWKKRSKHGRDKIFSSPEILMEAANEYFQYCIDNPLYEMIIQSGKEFHVPKMRAFTIKGLCIFLNIEHQTFNDYDNNTDGRYKDYIQVITRIKDIITTQKFEGAAAGFLNPNIIARDLGLKDESKVEHSGEIKTNTITAINQEEQQKIEELLKKFNDE